MISRTSSWPEIKTRDLQTELAKRHVWVSALTILGYVCYYILGTILTLASARRHFYAWYGGDPGMSMADFLSQSTSGWLGRSSATFVMTIMIAIMTACASFFFLYKSQAVDFYFSQPITRKRQFINVYINGMAAYAGLTLIFTLIATILAALMHAVTAQVIGEIFINLFRNLLLFFAVYNTVILAILISKTYLTAIIVAGIFLLAEPLICVIYSLLQDAYYATYYDVSWMIGAAESNRIHIFSPAMNHVLGAQVWSDNLAGSRAALARVWQFDAVTLIFGLIVGYLAFMAYQKRKAEDIGPGIVYPAAKNVLKLIVAIPMAVATAAVVDTMLETSYSGINVLSVVMLIFMAAVVCMVTEIICAGHMKGAIKSLWHIAVASVLAIAVFLIFKNDLTGYDSFVPDTDDIETCALFKDYGLREMYDEDGYYLNPSEYYVKHMNLADREAVCEIAGIGQVTQRQNRIYSESTPDERSAEDRYITGNDAVVVYKLKNGRYAARTLMIPADIDPALMDRVIGTDEYRDTVYGLDMTEEMVSTKQADGYLAYDIGFDRSEQKIGPDEFMEFLENFRQDLKQYDYSLASTEFPTGCVTFNADPSGSGYTGAYFSYTYEIYGCYTHTIDYLKSIGIYMESSLDAKDISSVDIYMTVYEDDDPGTPLYDCDAAFDDPEDIGRIAGEIVYINQYEWMIPDETAGINVSYRTYTDDDVQYSGEYYGIIPISAIPQDMMDAIKENVVYDYNEYMSDSMDYASSTYVYAQ